MEASRPGLLRRASASPKVRRDAFNLMRCPSIVPRMAFVPFRDHLAQFCSGSRVTAFEISDSSNASRPARTPGRIAYRYLSKLDRSFGVAQSYRHFVPGLRMPCSVLSRDSIGTKPCFCRPMRSKAVVSAPSFRPEDWFLSNARVSQSHHSRRKLPPL